MSLHNKFSGCMLSAALGDALGASFYVHRAGVLRYTDDTAMMIALAEHIIENRGRVDPKKLAWKFVEAYEREPWRGYGPGPPRIFRLIRRGEGPLELDRRLYPGGSFGNGGAMRIAPIGLYYHDKIMDLEEVVKRSCKPTHNHPFAIEGALLEAASIAMVVKVDSRSEVNPVEFVEKLIDLPLSDVYRRKLKLIPKLIESDADRRTIVKTLGNTVEAHNSVPAAVYCYLREQDPLRTISRAISLGGDRDTIACMAAAIAGAHRGLKMVPAEYLDRLENYERIRALAEKLCSLKLELEGR